MLLIGDTKTTDRSIYLNTSLSIQVIAPRLQERRLFEAMEVIEQVLRASAGGEMTVSSKL